MLYFDCAATTRSYPEVIDTMTDIMTNYWANPSSNNSLSDEARLKIEQVREQFAQDLNCSPNELIFTSGGCESNSLAIQGFLAANFGYSFYYSSLEHASINELVDKLPYRVLKVKIPNNLSGKIGSIQMMETIIRHQVHTNQKPFISIGAASSEVGAIQDIKELAKVVHKYGGAIHCDAVQLFPEQRIDVKDWDVDMLSISAQKFHGPRGVGILYVKDGIKIDPIIYGSQESGLRGGTYNTAAICGMGVALELTRQRNATEYIRGLRNKMLDKLLYGIQGTHLNGPGIWNDRLANNISLTIDGVHAEKLMTLCDLSGLIIARGSACQSHNPVPSPALKAIGLTDEQALSTIRITLDEFTTEQEVDEAAEIITKLVERIRNIEEE